MVDSNKRYKLLFIFLCVFVVSFILIGCADEVVSNNNLTDKQISTQHINYNNILNSGEWRSFTSFQQRMQACQIPDNILHKLSTAQLVKLLAHHPLNSICFAYDNPMTGVNYFLKEYNGLAELRNRTDAAKELLDFYKGIDFTNVTDDPYPITLTAPDGEKYSSSNISFMELLIASNTFPQLCDNSIVDDLGNTAKEKLQQKISKNNIYSSHTISKTLMVQARIMLMGNSLDLDQRKMVQEFYNCGGTINAQQISQTINKDFKDCVK